MKNILILFSALLFSFMFSFKSYGQAKPELVTNINYVFCELQTTSISLNRKTRVQVDFGNEINNFNERILRDDNGKKITFNSMIDALNFMNKKGWDFVQAYITVSDGDSVTHWLLKKRME